MALTVFFAWRYRASEQAGALRAGLGSFDRARAGHLGGAAADHHLPRRDDLDRARICSTPTGRSTASPPGSRCRETAKPLEVEVVALDWKWLFIYPEYGIATVNELAAPVDRPIHFRITSSSVMNSFYIPALAGQIYAMPGMETQLHAVINKPGDYRGLLGQLQRRRLLRHALPLPRPVRQATSTGWVAKAKAGGRRRSTAPPISSSRRPSENVPRAPLFRRRRPGALRRRSSTCASSPARCA